jgi:hypothetical protein
MTRFPRDAPKRRVVKTLERLGFRIVREHEHISFLWCAKTRMARKRH